MHSLYDENQPVTANSYNHTDEEGNYRIALVGNRLQVEIYKDEQYIPYTLSATKEAAWLDLIKFIDIKNSNHLPAPGNDNYNLVIKALDACKPTKENLLARIAELEAQIKAQE